MVAITENFGIQPKVEKQDDVSRQVETTVMPIHDDNLQIIYKNNKPYGIRDKGGYLFFFVNIGKYTGQEERYRREVEQQYRLADYLLEMLKKA